MNEKYADIARVVRSRYNAHARAFAFKDDDRAWLRPLIERFREVVPARGLVLDLGCAGGRETVELGEAGMRVVGLDIARESPRIAVAARPAYGYVEGDMIRLPFADASLDGIWASASLLHLPPGAATIALTEAARVLKRGGGLYTTVQHGNSKGWVPPKPGQAVQAELYYAHYQPDEWRHLVEGAGFKVVTSHVTDNPDASNFGATGWIEVTARKP
jgi:SAM-dependent methyltransferase